MAATLIQGIYVSPHVRLGLWNTWWYFHTLGLCYSGVNFLLLVEQPQTLSILVTQRFAFCSLGISWGCSWAPFKVVNSGFWLFLLHVSTIKDSVGATLTWFGMSCGCLWEGTSFQSTPNDPNIVTWSIQIYPIPLNLSNCVPVGMWLCVSVCECVSWQC